MKIMQNLAVGAMVVAFWFTPGQGAAALLFHDGFETYPAESTLAGNGWGFSGSGTVVVQTNVVWGQELGTNAAYLPPLTTLSNLVGSAASTSVWTELYTTNSLTMPAGPVDASAVNPAVTVQWFFETNGYPVVWNRASNSWLVCSNDHWGAATTNFNTNAWTRFTVCANYSNHTAAFFLNQHLMLEMVPFISNYNASVRIQMEGGYAVSSYVDEVSVRYSPTNMTVDLDNDGMADATEIQQYGSVAVRHRPVITVVQPAHGSIAPSNSFEVMPGGSTSFTFRADAAYVVEKVYTNGQSVVAFTGQNTRVASLAWNSIFTNGLSDGTVSALVSYVATRYVPQDGYATIQEAMQAAAPGETVIVSNGTYTGNVTLGNGVALVGTNVVVSGNLSVAAGTTATVWNSSGLVVSNGTTTVNGMLVVSNGTVDLGTLLFGVGATVRVVNATSFTADGVIFTGSFTLDAAWKSTLVARTPPFSDGFEAYPTNTALAQLGQFGWSASDAGVVVEGTVYTLGFKAVQMPAGAVLSNSLNSAARSNVWMEWVYKDPGRIDESLVALADSRTNMAMIVFINTNDYLVAYDGLTCKVLSNDVWGVGPVTFPTSTWTRLALNLNYATHEVAVMANGRLMAQKLQFINADQSNCARFEADGGLAGNTYLDDLHVLTNALQITSGDRDSDGIRDAEEIDHSGDVFIWPRGSVFKIR